MPRRVALRWLLVASFVLVGVLTRSANAAVPFCDARGATGLAPPPVLPVRDVRVDAAPPGPLCLDPTVLLEVEPPRSERGGGPPRADDVWIDLSLPAGARAARTHALEARAAWPPGDSLPPLRGHARGVFHPPR